MKQQGLVWSNIAIPAIEDDQISFIVIMLIMMIDTVLYFLIAWYKEGVFPGRYGVAKPWYFPFMPSYWCGQRCANVSLNRSRTSGARHVLLQENEEEESVTGEVVFFFCVCKIVKTFVHVIGSQIEEDGCDNCEAEPNNLPLGISIQRLSKKFSTGFLLGKRKKILAVNDLSLNFYEGQITAFLGHNGAGKTTTM